MQSLSAPWKLGSFAGPLLDLRPTANGAHRPFKKLPNVCSGTVDTVSCHMPDMFVTCSHCNMASSSGSLQASCSNCLASVDLKPLPASQVGEECL